MTIPQQTDGLTVVPRPVAAFSLFREWTRLDGVSMKSLCPRGAAIYAPGETADSVYLIKAGKVKIVRPGPDGKRIIAHLVSAGEIFGEGVLAGEAHRGNLAEVLEDASLRVIPAKSVLDWVRPRPEVWRELAFLFAKRLRFLEGAVERLLFGEVEERAVRLLLELAKQYGEPGPDGIGLRIELSQREFAHMIGSTRETTSSVLNQLAKRGLLKIRRRRLAICSLESLARSIGLTALISIPKPEPMPKLVAAV